MAKLVDGQEIAMLHDFDDCMGCFGCETACRETNHYSYEEDWMKVVRGKPVLVKGKLRQHHLVAPALDQCRVCYDNDPEPLCVTGCPGKALMIGSLADIAKEAAGRHCAIYTA